MSRFRASAIHLLVSAILVGLSLPVVFLIWYPDPLFSLEGVAEPLKILLIVHLVVGPFLTLIIFRSGKPGLKFDLAVIFILQLSALGYGLWSIGSQRPAVIAFAVNRFFVVSHARVDLNEMDAQLASAARWLEPHIVFAEPTPDAVPLEVLMGAPDIHEMPRQYRPWSANFDRAAARAMDIEAIRQHPQAGPLLATWLNDNAFQASEIVVFPLHGRKQHGVMIFAADDGRHLGYIDRHLEWMVKSGNR